MTVEQDDHACRAWENEYPEGISWRIAQPKNNIVRHFDDATKKFADREAIRFQGRSFSYEWIEKQVDRLSVALRAIIEPGEHVGFLLPNGVYHPVALFAVLKAGGVVVQLSTFDAELEIRHKLADSDTRVLITAQDPELLPKARCMRAEGRVERLIVFESDWDIEDARPACFAEVDHSYLSLTLDATQRDSRSIDRDLDQLALIQYTGGTTGTPKGVPITHRNLMAALAGYWHWFAGAEGQKTDPERVICVVPLSHVYGLVTIFLRHFLVGNLILLHRRYRLDDVIRNIVDDRATTLQAVPTVWNEIVNFPGIDALDLSSLTVCSAGGAPISPNLSARISALAGSPLRGGWGMTETIALGTNRPATRDQRPGSIGIPMPGLDLKIADPESGATLLPGRIGEIYVRGHNVVAGYLNDREPEAFVDGWFRSGDLGCIDHDGFVYLTGRRKEMLLVNGFNVYPQIVEQAIHEHPKVGDAIVVGLPDEHRGETVGAFVTLRPGHGSLTLEELRDDLSRKLGRHEMPTSLAIRASLPKTSMGKPSRSELLNELGIFPAGREAGSR